MTTSTSFPTLLDPIESDVKLAKDVLRRTTGDSAVPDVVRSWILQLRTDLDLAQAELASAVAQDRSAYLAAGRELLEAWRARVAQLRVQANLASMDARDDVQGALAAAEKARAVAEQHLVDAGEDARATLDSLRAGVEESFAQLVAAGQAAVGVVQRYLAAQRSGD